MPLMIVVPRINTNAAVRSVKVLSHIGDRPFFGQGSGSVVHSSDDHINNVSFLGGSLSCGVSQN